MKSSSPWILFFRKSKCFHQIPVPAECFIQRGGGFSLSAVFQKGAGVFNGNGVILFQNGLQFFKFIGGDPNDLMDFYLIQPILRYTES